MNIKLLFNKCSILFDFSTSCKTNVLSDWLLDSIIDVEKIKQEIENEKE